jgi:hypothetical protein
MSGFATVDDQNPKIAPTLTSGKVTPEVLHRWEKACKEYFRVKSVAGEKQVESVLSRFQDFHIADWAEANDAILKDLDFAMFMGKLRERLLEKDWDRKIKLAILASKQGDRPFEEWACELMNRNALLRGRTGHFTEEALRESIQNNMDQGLEKRIRRKIAEGLALHQWIEAVREEAEVVAWERELYRGEPKGRATSNRVVGARIENTVPTMQRPAGGSSFRPVPGFTALPKLTPAERSIIFDHQGCFKCRQLYVDHRGANCPNDFPQPGTYKTLTTSYAEAVRDSKNKPKTRAGRPVAHVGYVTVEREREGAPSAVLGIGEEESDDSEKYVQTGTLPPFSSSHLECVSVLNFNFFLNHFYTQLSTTFLTYTPFLFYRFPYHDSHAIKEHRQGHR